MRCIEIGINNFVLNLKRKNFIVTSAIFLCALGVYLSRHIGDIQMSNNISAFSIYIFNYFIMFISCYIVAADSENGMHRIIYTSSLSKIQVIGYKYVTSIMTAIWFWGIVTIFRLVFLCIYPNGDGIDIVIKSIIANLVIILLSTIHITSFIMLVSSILKKYMVTLIVTFMSYALLNYFYQLYVFLMQKSVRLLEFMPMILVNELTNARSLTLVKLIILFMYTIVFTLIAYVLQKRLDID